MHTDDRPAVLIVDENEVFQRVQRLRDKLRALSEEWNYRFTLNNAGFMEKWLSGRFVILLNFEAEPTAETVAGVASKSSHRTTSKLSVAVASVDPGNLIEAVSRSDNPVLVNVVKFAENPEESVSGFTRLYQVYDNCGDAGRGRLYRGISTVFGGFSTRASVLGAGSLEGVYQRLSGFMEWERDALGTRDDLVRCVVERGAIAVDSLPQYHSKLERKSIGDQLYALAPSIGLIIDNQSCEISFGIGLPHGLKFAGAMIGPYDP